MKKKVLALLMVVTCFVTMVGCGAAKGGNDSSKLEFSSNATTGYSWSYTTWDDSVVEVVDEGYVAKDAQGADGVGGVQTYSFKGLKAGATTVEFLYSREGIEDPSDKMVSIDVIVADDLSVTTRISYM